MAKFRRALCKENIGMDTGIPGGFYDTAYDMTEFAIAILHEDVLTDRVRFSKKLPGQKFRQDDPATFGKAAVWAACYYSKVKHVKEMAVYQIGVLFVNDLVIVPDNVFFSSDRRGDLGENELVRKIRFQRVRQRGWSGGLQTEGIPARFQPACYPVNAPCVLE